mmetsp:Transcript_65425/g.182046  ORF Transcript_65425/g.182046 Transcript_65425/m.182046 type:complete len:206 (-) Transcript_65425:892-1509(-)
MPTALRTRGSSRAEVRDSLTSGRPPMQSSCASGSPPPRAGAAPGGPAGSPGMRLRQWAAALAATQRAGQRPPSSPRSSATSSRSRRNARSAWPPSLREEGTWRGCCSLACAWHFRRSVRAGTRWTTPSAATHGRRRSSWRRWKSFAVSWTHFPSASTWLPQWTRPLRFASACSTSLPTCSRIRSRAHLGASAPMSPSSPSSWRSR